MRKTTFLLGSVLAATSLTVSAQDADELEVVVEENEEVDFGGGNANTPEEYVVRRGDTLWDLSERFLNSPWYWPKLWSYNPQLDNPNWIRPGTRIKFYPGDARVPAPAPVKKDSGFSDVPTFQGNNAATRFAYTGDVSRRRRDLFVSKEDIDRAGRIANSPQGKTLLSIYDRVYIDDTDADNGQTMQVFRVGKEVRHPITHALLGRKVTVLGTVRIELVGDNKRVGLIENSWDDIARGDMVADIINTDLSAIAPRSNEKEMKGYVVSAARFPLSVMGGESLLYIDKGKSDGVKIGNTFTVVRAEDPYLGQTRDLEDLVIGELMVTDVRDTTSTAVVTKARREIVPGDRIEMRIR